MTDVINQVEVDFTPEDIEAKQLMEKWSKEVDSDTQSIASDGAASGLAEDYDDDLEQYRREVPGANDNNVIDHIVLGTSDLDRALEDFESLTGAKPVMVVSLNGLGTKSARIAFNSCSFLEIIGPDPKQSSRPLGDKLGAIPEGKMIPIHYAVRHRKAPQMKESEFAEMGFPECDQVTMVAKDRGLPWTWDLVFMEGHEDAGLVPYFVNWRDSHHASGRLPVVGDLKTVVVRAPSDNAIHKLLANVEGVETEDGENFVKFQFTSPKGTHTFSGSSLIGVSFPTEGGLPVKGMC